MHKLKDRLQIVRNQEKPKALESVASALDAQPSPEMGMPDNPAQMAAVAKAAKATPPKIDLASSGGVKKTKRALHRMVDRALQRDFHGLDVVENSKKALKKGAHALIEGKKIHFAPGMLADMPQGQDLLRHEGMIQEIEKQLKGGSDIREIADKLGNGAKEILSQGSISNSPSMAPAANGMFKAPANVVANAPEPLLNLVSGNDGAAKQELPSESDLLNMKLPVKSEEDIARGEEQEEENEQAIESKERNEQPEKESAEQKTKDKEKEAGEGQEGEGAEKEGEEAAKEGKEEGKKDGKQGVKDRQGKAKDKADKKKGKKGKAGAEEKGEDKKGDEAQSAAAEGAGQEIQSKIESSQSAVGAAAATGSEGGVQEQPAAENSGPANVGMTIANAAAVQAAGVQGNVIKEIGTNEEGEAVFVVAGPVEAAAEGGDAGDGKPKPKVKAMPGDMQGDMEAANREKIQAAIAEFQSQAAGEVSQLNGLSGSASSQVMAGAESAKGSVTSAAASQKAAVTAAIAAQKAAVQTGAETAKAQAQSALEAQMAALAAGAESAKAELESQWAAQDAALAAMEGEMIGKINAAVNKAKTDLTQVAETKAQEATAIGEQRAAQYEAEPLAQQSGWEDFTNGSDYPKNKRDAKVKAARETAKKFAESFKQKAQEAVAKIGGEGTAQLTNYITQSVAGGRQAIAQRKTAAIAQIDTSRSATEAQLQSSHQTTVASIDASAQSTQASLDQQQGGAIAQIEGAAQGKIQGISQAAAQTAAALQQQAQQALESLNAQIAAAVASVQGRKEQNPVAIKQALAQSLEAIRTGVSQARTGVEGAATASTAGFQQQASEGAAEMAQKATEASSSAQTTASGAVSGMTAQASGFASSAAGQVSAATASMTQQAQQAGTEMAGQVTAIRTDFEATIAKVVAQFEKDKTAFNSTLQAEIGKLPAEITSQAEKAEKAVQPRWKSIVMFVVNIVVMILITAAVIAAFASGGILLAIGVPLLAGAAGGILKYGVQQGLNGEPMTWQGVAKAGFEGAMDGLNIAAGVVGGPAAQILTGAAVGAAKYAGGFAIDYAFASDEQRANMQFSFGQMAMGAAGGAIEGALGALGGHYADGMGPGIRNFVGGKIIEATADTVGSALAAPFNHYAQTGEWDPGKILEELSPQNFAQNFIMGVAVDKGAARLTGGGGSSTPSTTSSTPNTSNSATPTTTPTTNTPAPVNTPTTNTPAPVNTPTTNTPAPVNTPTTNTPAPVNTPATNTPAPVNTPATNTPVNNGPVNTPATNTPVNNGPVNTPATNTPANNGPVNTPATNTPDAKTPDSTTPETTTPDTNTKTPENNGPENTPENTPENKQDAQPTPDGRSNPPAPAPVGYHWKLINGKYVLSRNPNMADSLPPLEYDPSTGGFRNKETGDPHSGDIASNTVRGQDYNGFVATVKGLDPNSPEAQKAFELYARKKWADLEAHFKQHNLNDGWPPNRGFISIKDGTLPVGAKFDRFGGYIDKASGQFTDKGTFVAPYGSDYTGRALPKGTDSKAFKGYEVIKPIPMKEGPAIPWFGEKGNGTQYELSMGIKDLIDGGYIREVAAPDLSAMKDPQGTTSTTSTTKTPETTTADPVNSTPDPTKTTPENTTPANTTPENTNTNTNTNGDNGGGGMKGANVYKQPTDAKNAISALKPAELNTAIETVVTAYGAVDGARVRPTDKPGVFKMFFTKRPIGSDLPSSVEVTFKVSGDGAFKTNTAASSHGADQGPAINRVTYDSKTGAFKVEIELNGSYSKADIDKMTLHELNEVAEIIRSVDTKKTQQEIDNNIADQQKASVFDSAADPTKAVSSSNMTAHDKAVIKEIKQLVADTADGAKSVEAREKLQSLGKSMAINGPFDARMAAILESLPGLNADQIAALCNRDPAPSGYKWVKDATDGLAVQNEPNNKGPVREYNPLDTSPLSPFPISKTTRPTPDRFAQETTTTFTLGSVSSKADPKSGVQSIQIDHTQISAAEKKQLDDIHQDRTNAKIKKDGATTDADRSAAHGELVRASESLGNVATEIAIAKMLPGAKKLECELPGDGKSGQFDSVYEHNGEIYVVESKGASSERGTRKDSSGKHNEQGTKEYLDSIVENMEAKIRKSKADPAYTSDPNFKQKIDDLQATVNKIKDADLMGTLHYLQVSQRIETNVANKGKLSPIEILKFDI
jgi:hypothetical protein